MGKFYGLFFYLCALSFKVVWFTALMEKRQLLLLLLPLPVQCKETTSLLVSSRNVLVHFIYRASSETQQLVHYQYTRSLFAHTAETSLF